MSQLYAVTGRRYTPNYGDAIRAQSASLPQAYQLRDQREAQNRSLDLQQQDIDLQGQSLEWQREANERNMDLARRQMDAQKDDNSQSNMLGLAGLGINYGLGAARNRTILEDTGANMLGDASGVQNQFGASMFGPNVSRGATGLSLGGATTGEAFKPASQPNVIGDFARNYGGAIAGGIGGALLGDDTQERVLYGLGGAAIGDLVSGGSLIRDVIGSAVDWAGAGLTSMFGF